MIIDNIIGINTKLTDSLYLMHNFKKYAIIIVSDNKKRFTMFNMTPISTNFSASRKYGNNRMIVYSPKLQRQVTLYSNLEYYCYLMLEFDSEIINFCEQPNLMISNYSNNKNLYSQKNVKLKL